MVTILLVDDHTLFRQGVAALFDIQPDIQVVGQCGSVNEAVIEVEKFQPDIILMDFHLPDGTGLDATRLILDKYPAIKIIFLTITKDDERLFSAIRSGAKGYLQKNVPVNKLLNYVNGVQRGEAAITPTDTGKLLKMFANTRQSTTSVNVSTELTLREMDVLIHLTRGLSNREISAQLSIAENTVKNHVRKILAKLKLNNRREAAQYALKHGLISSDSSKSTKIH